MAEVKRLWKINAPNDAVSQSEAAAAMSVSRSSVQRAAEVIAEGTPEETEAAATGGKTVAAAAKTI